MLRVCVCVCVNACVKSRLRLRCPSLGLERSADKDRINTTPKKWRRFAGSCADDCHATLLHPDFKLRPNLLRLGAARSRLPPGRSAVDMLER